MRTTSNVQVPGFCDGYSYLDVVERGARGLGIQTQDIKNLKLVVSGGLVCDTPLEDGKPWTLGQYVCEIGGQAARGKKTFGIHAPESDNEDEGEEVK